MLNKRQQSFLDRLHEIIYEADTPAGKLFDLLLLVLIGLSVFFVMLESIVSIKIAYSKFFFWSEWVITLLFTVEYLLRILCVKQPKKYIFSFYGIIDLLSTLPSYLSLFIVGSQAFLVLRTLRLLRIFRILKLVRYIKASSLLLKSLKNSRIKITVFLFAVMIICIILGTLMYLIEGAENPGFKNIPSSIYWTIVTLTTVGYGDITPTTPLGQTISALIMILGYGIIAVPTGIVSAEYSSQKQIIKNTKVCPNCNNSQHNEEAKYCHECGYNMNEHVG